MNDLTLRYVNNNSALLHYADNKNHIVSSYHHPSPSLKVKSKNSKDSSSVERPRSSKMRYADISSSIRPSKSPIDHAEKKYSPLVSDKKSNFNMTFHNLNIYKARETPPKKTTTTAKKPADKMQERLTFYQQLHAKNTKKSIDHKQSLDYSNYPSSRQNSRIFGQEENIENIEKRPPVLKNNLISQRDIADLLTDVKNLPYIIKGMAKYMPSTTGKSSSKAQAYPFSNNSSFYRHDEESGRNHEQHYIDEKRIKLNQEDYSPNKSKASIPKDPEPVKKHRRGYSMGTPIIDKAELERQLEKHLQLQYQHQQSQSHHHHHHGYDQRHEQKHEQRHHHVQHQQQYNQHQEYYFQKQQQQQYQAQLQAQAQAQNHNAQQLAIADPQQDADEFYAQFFNTSKQTFDFERLIISQRNKGGGLYTPVASPISTKKPHHQRTSSMGEDPTKSNPRWSQKRASVGDQPYEKQNSELVELINMMDNPDEKAEFVQYIQDRQNFEQVMNLLENRYRNDRNHYQK